MEEMRQALGVLFALGLLGGCLWWLRRKGVAQFALKTRGGAKGGKTMQIIERLPLTPHHSLHLVRVADKAILVAVSPGGCSLLDSISVAAEEGIAPR